MAVAEMRKLNLVAMSYDRDGILNALQRTRSVEIKRHYEAENTAELCIDGGELSEYLARTEGALSVICAEVENYNREKGVKSDALKDGFFVSYTDFISAASLKNVVDETVKSATALESGRKALMSEQAKLARTIQSAEIYGELTEPFSAFSDTVHTAVRLGTLPVTALDALTADIAEQPLCCFEVLRRDGDNALIVFAFHKSVEGDKILAEVGFANCPFKENSGKYLCASLKARAEEIAEKLKKTGEEIYALGENIKTLKIYCDYLGFELEKLNSSEKMRATSTTFLLEAFVPKEAEEKVAQAIASVSEAAYYEFSQPADDEVPPTLYKNNEVVKNFETITNMYSPVNSREFDPNGIMAFFYSLFLGFIMGDAGYGLVMLLGGGFIYMKKRASDSGLKRLAGVFAIGGIFAIVWGLLFNSVFGFSLPYQSVMPVVLTTGNRQMEMWHVMGIAVPAMLVISLGIGVVHLMAGYVCKAVQCMRRGQFWDGILDGLVWTVFSVGIGLVVLGVVDEANMPKLAYIGGATAGAMLIVAMLTAGRKEKLLGKFTKGFGAAYGIINYVSDILSYARLYGLMLSGAVISWIISDYSLQFISSGNAALIILAIFLMLVGHVFNLAIGLLGAYIHDARLQYVEFYGRFYEGEGELFAPLGSSHKFINLEKI